MEKKIFIIEYRGDEDRGFDGFKRDTKPILNAINEITDYECEIVFYIPERKEELEEYLKKNAYCVISRIKIALLKHGVDKYFQFLKRLSESGVKVHTDPDVMINLEFKDILAKLKDTPFGEQSSYFYRDFAEFSKRFPTVLRKEKARVLKTNYGSIGKGVYLVHYIDGEVECTEALHNQKRVFPSVYDFLKYFEDRFEKEEEDAVYFKGKKGFVSCKYLPRISEGEIRVLLVKDRAVAVVHKVPQKGEFSASLLSGAKYEYESPTLPKWRNLIEFTLDGLDYLEEYCEETKFPLLWTMDYILDTDEKGEDIYVLSEINCSYVDISNEPRYAKDMAEILKNG